jgi:hypothetical protein
MATRHAADSKHGSACTTTPRHQPRTSPLDGQAAAQQLLGWMHSRVRVAPPHQTKAVFTPRLVASASVTACQGRGQAPAGAPPVLKQRGSVLLAPIHVVAGGARGVLWLAGLPLGVLLGRRGKAGGDPVSTPARLPARTKEERERLFLEERRRYAAEECRGLFLLRGLERQRTAEFFKTFASDKWRLEEDRSDGTEVWRLPGSRIHTIMGIHNVNAAPKTALDMFSDPKAVFTRVFPRVDTMFITGRVLETVRGGEALCAAIFKLPNLVGPGSAPGFPPREMVWRQFVTRLATGNVLVTAATGDENAGAHKAVIHSGAVRGTLLTSGYYGRKLPGAGRTRVFYIASADPCGIIPAWLVNFAAGRQAGNVTRLAELFKTGRFV